MKRVLILGGTNFIGRNLVEKLLEINNYEVTLFNRQCTHSDIFPNINKIKGDRETDEIRQIKNVKWNYVIDLSCYYPDSLKSVLDCLIKVDKFIFISTCSVYDHEGNQSTLKNEQSELLSCDARQRIDRNPETYGNRKAECERILKDSGLAYTILRPALVYGKYDPTDRLYYWLYQVKMNNVLLLPENGLRLFSTTYVSDLVEAIIQCLNLSKSETFNVITNPRTSIKQIIHLASQTIKTDNSIINVSADLLKREGVSQWTDMPLWINGDYFTYTDQKIKERLGIRMTQFKMSLDKTIEYFDSINWPQPKYGMTEKTRQKLIKKMKNYSQ